MEPRPSDADRWAALRSEYAAGGLVESDLAADPVTMFGRWLDDAVAAGLTEPNAMVVSTVSGQGQPSSRMVLLKGVTEQGFVFFTNLHSHKGREIEDSPGVSLLFPWHPLQRQVRIEGTASPVGREEVQAYFASRPRGAQLGAWASPQSQPVSGRAELEQAFAEVEARFAGADVPPPPHWGGYRVRPEHVEFWQGRPGRMHDRLAYLRTDAGWAVQRLAP